MEQLSAPWRHIINLIFPFSSCENSASLISCALLLAALSCRDSSVQTPLFYYAPLLVLIPGYSYCFYILHPAETWLVVYFPMSNFNTSDLFLIKPPEWVPLLRKGTHTNPIFCAPSVRLWQTRSLDPATLGLEGRNAHLLWLLSQSLQRDKVEINRNGCADLLMWNQIQQETCLSEGGKGRWGYKEGNTQTDIESFLFSA